MYGNKIFLDLKASQNASLIVVVVVVVVVIVISSVKMPKAFLMQQSAMKLCTHIRPDIPHRSTISNFYSEKSQ